MDEAMRRDRGRAARRSRRRDGAGDGRRRLPRRASTRRRVYVAHRAARGAHLLADAGSCKGLVTLTAGGVPGQLHPARRDAGRSAQRLRKFPTCASRVRNMQTFNIGGGNCDIDFAIRGPELDDARRVRRAAARARRRELGHRRRRHHAASSTSPSCASQIDRERAADLGVDTQDIAAALRLMVGGDQEVTRFRDPSVDEDYDVQLRLRRGRSQRSRHDLAGSTCRAPNGELVRLDNVVTLEQAQQPVAHRPAGSPAPGQRCAPASRPATRWPTASRRSSRPRPS